MKGKTMKQFLILLMTILVSAGVAFGDTESVKLNADEIKSVAEELNVAESTAHSFLNFEKKFNSISPSQWEKIEKSFKNLSNQKKKDMVFEKLYEEYHDSENLQWFFKEWSDSFNIDRELSYDDAKMVCGFKIVQQTFETEKELIEVMLKLRNFQNFGQAKPRELTPKIKLAVLRLKYEILAEELIQLEEASNALDDDLKGKVKKTLENKKKEVYELKTLIENLDKE